MKKRVISLLLAGVMVIGTLAGCGGGKTQEGGNAGGTAAPAAAGQESGTDAAGGEATDDRFAEPMEISIAMWDIESLLENKENDSLYNYICDKFNISIEPVNTTWEDYGQKIQTWAATGSLPDIFCTDAVGTAAYYNWTEQEVVRPLLPLDSAKYPNLAKYFETPDIAAMANADGEYFAVPRRMFPTVDWSALDRIVAYRWDIAQEAGITKEPETWEEFEQMLTAIKEKDPENSNIGGLTSTSTKFIGGLFWLYSNPVATSDGSGSDFKWVKEGDQYVPAIFTDKSLPALENMRKMYENGLVDKDLANTSVETAYDKFVAGNYAAVLMGGGYVNVANSLYETRWKELYPDKKFTDCVKVLKPLKNADGEYAHAIFKTYWSESYFATSVDDAKMDRIMALYDWLVSDEGIEVITYGVPGEDYTKEGDTITLITENLREKSPSKGLFGDLAAYNTDKRYDINSPVIVNTDIRQEAVDYINWVLDNTKVPEYYPELTMLNTPTKQEFVVLDHDDLLQIMMGTEPVKDMWDAKLADYEAKGLSKMIEEVNAAAK